MEEFKILDEILQELKDKTEENPMTMEDLFWHNKSLFNTSPRLRYTVMNKLVKDGYAELKEIKDLNVNVVKSTYLLTYEGLIFINKGGYKSDFSRKKSSSFLNYTLSFTIAISGITTSVYYVLEMCQEKEIQKNEAITNTKTKIESKSEDNKIKLQIP
jgi:hypothetical protein